MKPSDIKLGYLLVTTPVPNVYIGGVMVTDGRGLPIEFRYTEPIQPTRIQQVLYGQVLSAYIKREVVLETLLKSIESKFKCLLVEDENLLSYPGKGFSIIRIAQTKSSPIGPVGKVQEISPTEVLLQSSPEGSPVRLNLPEAKTQPARSEALSGDTLPASDSASPTEPYSVLAEAGQYMDVCEPLKRIEKALEIICQEAGITSATS